MFSLFPEILLLFLIAYIACNTAAMAAPSPSSRSPAAGAAFSFPPPPPAAPQNITLEYMDPSLPLLFLPDQTAQCSVELLRHEFSDTVGAPPISVEYFPPSDCPAPWSRVVLELSASASDVQKDRVAAIWLDGAEILRTSTPLPMAPGVFWHVHKDVTRYTSILRGGGNGSSIFALMLENSIATFPGVYSVNASLHFYRGALCSDDQAVAGQHRRQPELELISTSKTNPSEQNPLGCNRLSAHPTIKGLYREPADLIIPFSKHDAGGGSSSSSGNWFKINKESDAHVVNLMIPRNTYRAVLEVYVSHHDDDEYWYINPLRTNGPRRGGGLKSEAKSNGGFRQLVVAIDKRFAGSIVPFPLIYPGSINPFFWAPVAAIGAYDHPSYDFDLTPFVGLLLDGREHLFGITVVDSQPYWLLSANLHLWLDPWSDGIEGALVRYKAPPLRLSRQAAWRERDGKSSIDGQVIIRFVGWVGSSKGNITTSIRQRLKFKSRVEVHMQGSVMQAAVEVKSRVNLKTQQSHGAVVRVQVIAEAPLQLEMIRSNGGGGTVFEKTKLVHQLAEATSVVGGSRGATEFRTVDDRQEAEGSVLKEEEGGAAVWGSGDVKSTYKFRDDRSCYLRTVNVVGGRVVDDVDSASCASTIDM